MKRRTTNNNAANVGMLLSLLWYLVIGALFSVNALAQHAIQPNVNEKASPTVKTMGVQVLIYLYDKGQCEGSVLPAYRAFAQKAVTDPLVMLLRDVIPQVESIPTGYGAPSWSPAIYEDYIATLTGKEYYSSLGKEPKQGDVTTPKDMRILVDELVAPDLIRIFCLPRNLGFKPEQGMSSTALMTYLYSQSRWIEDYFTFAKEVSGPVSEIKLGEWSRFFSDEEVAAFDKELSQIKPPIDKQVLDEGFENLRTLVHTAATNPNYKLLLAIS